MSASASGHGEATHVAGSRLLDVENLRVEFQTEEGALTAVDGVSFHVDRGETVVLVGESGSGKSVTSLAIMRLIEIRLAASRPARSGLPGAMGRTRTWRNWMPSRCARFAATRSR